MDFPPYLEALADAGFAGTVSIELEYSPEPEKIVDWVREAYAATDRPMAGLGIRSEVITGKGVNRYGRRPIKEAVLNTYEPTGL